MWATPPLAHAGRVGDPPSVRRALTQAQVTSWRLSRHRLAERAPAGALEAVVGAVSGVQAQLGSAAELSLVARLEDTGREAVGEALWQRRTLVKTWAMRGTLHLLPADELPLWAAALSTRDGWRRASWLRGHGVELGDMEAVFELAAGALGDTGVTREELAASAPPHLRERLLSGWGELLKPAAAAGLLCFGPNRGRNVTFVRPRAWLGSWADLDPAEALRVVTRRWLGSYGPGTRDDLARWWGTQPAPAGRMLAAIEDELAEVDVDGRRAWALAADVDAIAVEAPPQGVRLLPHFDVYTLGYRPRELLVPARHEARVFRSAGWISPVVLVDGLVAGVWDPKTGRLELFRRLTRAQRTLLDAELAHMSAS